MVVACGLRHKKNCKKNCEGLEDVGFKRVRLLFVCTTCALLKSVNEGGSVFVCATKGRRGNSAGTKTDEKIFEKHNDNRN